MAEQHLRTLLGTVAGKLLGEQARIAALVGGRVSAAADVRGVAAKRGLNLQQLLARHQPPLHPVAAHQLHGMACRVERGLVAKEVRNAALQPVKLQPQAAHQRLVCLVAVGPQGHDLRHVALERRIVALAQKLQAPAPLRAVHARAQQQRGLGIEHPLQRLPGRSAVRPGLAVADGNLRRIGKTGFQRCIALPIHHGDRVAALQQMPRRTDADDAGAQNKNVHGRAVWSFLRASGRKNPDWVKRQSVRSAEPQMCLQPAPDQACAAELGDSLGVALKWCNCFTTMHHDELQAHRRLVHPHQRQ